jgi:hypothetical protein
MVIMTGGIMSEAKDFYYKVILRTRSQNDTHGNYTDQYIKELESNKADLMSDIFNIKNKYEKLETENSELLEFVSDICLNDIGLSDLNLDWVQLDANRLLNKFKEGRNEHRNSF